MKRIFIFMLGFTPLLVGYWMEDMISRNEIAFDFRTFYNMLCFGFFLYWGLLGFLFCKFTSSKIYTAIICNFPALIVLILALVQELIYKRYWSNNLGIATQFFYLPTLRLSYIVTSIFSMHTMSETYIISFISMLAVFYFGCYIRDMLSKENKKNIE